MRGKCLLGRIFAGLLLIVVSSTGAFAATVYVSGGAPGPVHNGLSWETAFLKIQEGINAAVAGDNVWVSGGTYYEGIALKDGVALYGGFFDNAASFNQRDWQVFVTIIDAGGNGHAVFIDNCSSTFTRIDGFTIKNGYFQPYDPSYTDGGGGVYCNQSNPVIENNTIIDNYGYFGGGIYALLSSPTIVNNIVMNNGALQGGAGIYLYSSSGLVSKNLISGELSMALRSVDHSTAIALSSSLPLSNGAGTSRDSLRVMLREA